MNRRFGSCRKFHKAHRSVAWFPRYHSGNDQQASRSSGRTRACPLNHAQNHRLFPQEEPPAKLQDLLAKVDLLTQIELKKALGGFAQSAITADYRDRGNT